MLFLSCFVMLSCTSVLMPCGHLLGKAGLLALLCGVFIVTLSLSDWYPRSGVVLDCIDSRLLASFLLLVQFWLNFHKIMFTLDYFFDSYSRVFFKLYVCFVKV